MIRCLYRFHTGEEIPGGHSHFQRIYTTRCPLGYGRPHRAVAFGLRLKEPRRVIHPLTTEQVTQFLDSFHTFRDFAVVGLMLLDGLRSCEIMTLQLEDLKLTDAQLRVLGKGRKQRILPLPAEGVEVLQNYLRLERPLTNSPFLFVSLKGRRRVNLCRRRDSVRYSDTIDCAARSPPLTRTDSDTLLEQIWCGAASLYPLSST